MTLILYHTICHLRRNSHVMSHVITSFLNLARLSSYDFFFNNNLCWVKFQLVEKKLSSFWFFNKGEGEVSLGTSVNADAPFLHLYLHSTHHYKSLISINKLSQIVNSPTDTRQSYPRAMNNTPSSCLYPSLMPNICVWWMVVRQSVQNKSWDTLILAWHLVCTWPILVRQLLFLKCNLKRRRNNRREALNHASRNTNRAVIKISHLSSFQKNCLVLSVLLLQGEFLNHTTHRRRREVGVDNGNGNVVDNSRAGWPLLL